MTAGNFSKRERTSASSCAGKKAFVTLSTCTLWKNCQRSFAKTWQKSFCQTSTVFSKCKAEAQLSRACHLAGKECQIIPLLKNRGSKTWCQAPHNICSSCYCVKNIIGIFQMSASQIRSPLLLRFWVIFDGGGGGKQGYYIEFFSLSHTHTPQTNTKGEQVVEIK